ncbi:MAG TPA: hypothetical protein VFE05_20475 [Longimicrobiaceae bacterium]|jgi:lauroyl/myristoyl acyltransferase|nr:hypothetical protein [Longimicrobiaceae bacterium]
MLATGPRAVRDAAPGPDQAALRRRADFLTAEMGADPAEVHAALSRLDERGLRGDGVQACHLNLLALLGGRWPAERVRAEAVRCAWTRLWRGWQYNSAMAVRRSARAAARVPVLAGWEAAPVEALRAGGRGVLVCGFHFGSYRFVPTDLARLGHPVTFAVDARTYQQQMWTDEELADLGPGFRMAMIDEPGGLVTLVRAVRRGEVAYLNVDGNRGWGMGHGPESHCEVGFLGQRLRVMTGAARIAAANGAALLPVAAVPDGRGPGRVVCGPPILPPAAGETQPAGATMQALYDFFAPLVADDPAEWQDVRFLHRWRVPDAPGESDPEAAERAGAAVEAHLAAGGTVHLDETRCMRLGGEADPELVDVRTLRSYRPPAWAAPLVAALAAPGGADAAAVRARFPGADGRRAAAGLAGELALRGLVALRPARGGDD